MLTNIENKANIENKTNIENKANIERTRLIFRIQYSACEHLYETDVVWNLENFINSLHHNSTSPY